MRRTGKTTALLQFCDDVDSTVFVSIRRGSNVTDFFCEYFPSMLKMDPYCPDSGVYN